MRGGHRGALQLRSHLKPKVTLYQRVALSVERYPNPGEAATMADNKPNVQAEHAEGQQIAHPGVQVLV